MNRINLFLIGIFSLISFQAQAAVSDVSCSYILASQSLLVDMKDKNLQTIKEITHPNPFIGLYKFRWQGVAPDRQQEISSEAELLFSFLSYEIDVQRRLNQMSRELLDKQRDTKQLDRLWDRKIVLDKIFDVAYGDLQTFDVNWMRVKSQYSVFRNLLQANRHKIELMNRNVQKCLKLEKNRNDYYNKNIAPFIKGGS